MPHAYGRFQMHALAEIQRPLVGGNAVGRLGREPAGGFNGLHVLPLPSLESVLLFMETRLVNLMGYEVLCLHWALVTRGWK